MKAFRDVISLFACVLFNKKELALLSFTHVYYKELQGKTQRVERIGKQQVKCLFIYVQYNYVLLRAKLKRGELTN